MLPQLSAVMDKVSVVGGITNYGINWRGHGTMDSKFIDYPLRLNKDYPELNPLIRMINDCSCVFCVPSDCFHDPMWGRIASGGRGMCSRCEDTGAGKTNISKPLFERMLDALLKRLSKLYAYLDGAPDEDGSRLMGHLRARPRL